MFQVVPPSIEYLKVIEPVTGILRTPVTLTEAVTDCPRIIGLGGVSVGIVIVGVALFTVNVAMLLVEPITSESPLYVALNL